MESCIGTVKDRILTEGGEQDKKKISLFYLYSLQIEPLNFRG